MIDNRELLLAVLMGNPGTVSEIVLRVRAISVDRGSFVTRWPIHFPAYSVIRSLPGLVRQLPGKQPHVYELTSSGIAAANASRETIGRIFQLKTGDRHIVRPPDANRCSTCGAYCVDCDNLKRLDLGLPVPPPVR